MLVLNAFLQIYCKILKPEKESLKLKSMKIYNAGRQTTCSSIVHPTYARDREAISSFEEF